MLRRTYRLINTGARADNVNTAEFLLGHQKHALQLVPVANISLLKNSPPTTCSRRRVAVDHFFGLRSQCEISKDNVTPLVKE